MKLWVARTMSGSEGSSAEEGSLCIDTQRSKNEQIKRKGPGRGGRGGRAGKKGKSYLPEPEGPPKPGDVVWAKVMGFTFWPAKVRQNNNFDYFQYRSQRVCTFMCEIQPSPPPVFVPQSESPPWPHGKHYKCVICPLILQHWSYCITSMQDLCADNFVGPMCFELSHSHGVDMQSKKDWGQGLVMTWSTWIGSLYHNMRTQIW